MNTAILATTVTNHYRTVNDSIATGFHASSLGMQILGVILIIIAVAALTKLMNLAGNAAIRNTNDPE